MMKMIFLVQFIINFEMHKWFKPPTDLKISNHINKYLSHEFLNFKDFTINYLNLSKPLFEIPITHPMVQLNIF